MDTESLGFIDHSLIPNVFDECELDEQREHSRTELMNDNNRP